MKAIKFPKKKLSQIGTSLSLYAGAGGMDIGFHLAGFKPLWSNDIDPYAVSSYKQILKSKHATAGDLLKQEIPKGINVDLVIGGPPCQGFSVAGKMDPDDPRSKHVWNFLGVVDQVRPRGFVMENVKSLAVNTKWQGLLKQLRAEAKRIGYETSLLVLNASHYGVPQARERMFLIGYPGLKVPAPVATTIDNLPSVKSALAKLPSYGEVGNDSICTAKITPAKNPILRKSPYAGMLFNGQGRPMNINLPALTLPASMGGNRTPIIDQEVLEGSNESWVENYHDRLMSGLPPLKTVPKHLRRITVEEAAALQTFPLGMKFYGSQSAQFRQIGNAVPPVLAYHVGKVMREVLVSEPLAMV